MTMLDLPHLVTPRLDLRLLGPQDYTIWRDAMLALPPPRDKWAPTGPEDTSEERFLARCDRRMKDAAQGSSIFFDVVHRRDNAYIGGAQIMDISRGIFQNAYIGYHIHPAYQRRRYAYEACVAIIGHAFGPLGLHRVEAAIEPDNEASLRLIKRLGLRHEGLSLRRLFIRDQWLDMSLWAMTSEEWAG
jgi:[ribosomal protein S5]-alanine N-acetyltransferase